MAGTGDPSDLCKGRRAADQCPRGTGAEPPGCSALRGQIPSNHAPGGAAQRRQGAWGSWGPGVVWARSWEVVGTGRGVGGSWGSWELSAVWAAWGLPSESGARAGCRVQDQEQGGSWEQGLVAASRGRTCGDSIVVGPGSVTDPAAAA